MKHHQDINEARYESFMKMTGGSKILSKVKKVNCASLFPCNKSLYEHIQRENFAAMIWRNADQCMPNVNNPLDFGWKAEDSETLQPLWFEGRAIPDFIPGESKDVEVEEMEDEELESVGECSRDSGDSESDE